MRGCPPFKHVACNALHTLGVAGTQKGRLLLFDAAHQRVVADWVVGDCTFSDSQIRPNCCLQSVGFATSTLCYAIVQSAGWRRKSECFIHLIDCRVASCVSVLRLGGEGACE